MIYALDPAGIKIAAFRGARASCPTCGEGLVARCGEIRVWHWAHAARIECDPWQESESEWHRSWKSFAPLDRVEICQGEHRADLIASDGCILELQHSPISVQEIQEREHFYGKMVWLLDGRVFWDQFRVEKHANADRFTWSHARPSWLSARKPVFIHGFSIGQHMKMVNGFTGKVEPVWKPLARSNDIFQIKSVQRRGRVVGTGKIIPLERFRQWIAGPPVSREE